MASKDNEKISKIFLNIFQNFSKNFFDLGQEFVPPAHLKAQWSDFFEDLTQIKTNQNKWKSMTFLIVLHLKPKTLLY